MRSDREGRGAGGFLSPLSSLLSSWRFPTPRLRLLGHPILRRLVQAVFVAFLLMVFAFLLIRLIPGDPAMILLGDGATGGRSDRLSQAPGDRWPASDPVRALPVQSGARRLRDFDPFQGADPLNRAEAAAGLAVADGYDHPHDCWVGAAHWVSWPRCTAVHGLVTPFRLAPRYWSRHLCFFRDCFSSCCSPFRSTWRPSPVINPDFQGISTTCGCRRSRSTLFWCRSSLAFSNLRSSKPTMRSS